MTALPKLYPSCLNRLECKECKFLFNCKKLNHKAPTYANYKVLVKLQKIKYLFTSLYFNRDISRECSRY